eukprot:4091142-Amphidinium_carterae.1
MGRAWVWGLSGEDKISQSFKSLFSSELCFCSLFIPRTPTLKMSLCWRKTMAARHAATTRCRAVLV